MTSYPLGSALVAEFDWTKNGALADPSPLPTIILAYKGDGSTITPPALTHTATGRFRATIFSALDTAVVEGAYSAIVATTDASMDYQAMQVAWSVGIADPISIAAAVWDRLTSALTTVGSIGKLIVTNLDAAISSRAAAGVTVTVTSPVTQTGDVTIEQGDDYFDADGRAIIWQLTGTVPDLTGATVTFKIQGFGKACAVSGTTVTLELTAAETARFRPTTLPYEVEAELADGHIASLVRGRLAVTAQIEA